MARASRRSHPCDRTTRADRRLRSKDLTSCSRLDPLAGQNLHLRKLGEKKDAPKSSLTARSGKPPTREPGAFLISLPPATHAPGKVCHRHQPGHLQQDLTFHGIIDRYDPGFPVFPDLYGGVVVDMRIIRPDRARARALARSGQPPGRIISPGELPQDDRSI